MPTTLRESDTERHVVITAIDDDITEFNEDFQLVILDATNGAEPSKVNNTANIIGRNTILYYTICV